MADKKEITEFNINMPFGWGYYNSFRFMHLRPAKNNRKKMVCVGRQNFSCREFFVRQMRSKFSDETGYWGSGHDIESSRVYVGVGYERLHNMEQVEVGQKHLRDKMSKSLAVLNALELEGNWPRTKMFPLNPTGKALVPGCLFIGDKKWNRSPYLMSLYTLIIRIGHWSWVPDKVQGKNWSQVHKMLSKAVGLWKTDADRDFVRQSLDYWPLLLKNYKYLFGYRNRAYQWSSARLSRPSYSAMEGIHKLVRDETYHERLSAKFRKLKKGINPNETAKDKKDKS